MNKKIAKTFLLATILFSTFNSAFAANAALQQSTPDALVRDLYKTHAQNNGAILGGKKRALLDRYFNKTLADLIWKDLTTHKNEVGVLDFDPFYNAQDFQIKKLIVGQPKIAGDKATVVVTFENYGQKETLNYLLARQNSDWKIADIKYKDGSGLLKYFKEAAQNNAAAAEHFFAGTYKVGATTCTVKPIKMAFEIKWAKSAGTMLFFFDGDASAEKYSYSTEKNGEGKDTFIFEDDRFETGKFIRADGKEMSVSKVE